MIIKKYTLIVMVALGLAPQTMDARTPTVQTAKQLGKTPLAQSFLKELKELFGTDIASMKVQTPGFEKKVVEPIKKLLEKYIPNETTRQLVTLKIGEYIATSPGFFIAASGDFELVGAIALEAMKYGHWGTAGAAALGTGAVWAYGFEKGKELLVKTKETLGTANIDCDSMMSAHSCSI